jgi:hypothetical protein
MDFSERFTFLWTAAQPKVANLISSSVADSQQAATMLQKVALSCLHKFSEYDGKRPFVDWVLEITRLELGQEQLQPLV